MTPRIAAKAAGELRYFTGKPCKRGHVAERRTSTGTCVPCAEKFVRSYERRHPAKVETARRDHHLKKHYGISSAEYDRMLTRQGGGCAICRSQDPVDRWGRFHVDHDHVTDAVRGLLCSNCNTGLGKFKDEPRRLQAAIAYLVNGVQSVN